METENFLSGYCRQLDDSRTVAVITENSMLTEVDCCFETCIYRPGCPIALQIEEIIG